jgi:hypothetical protein
MSDDRSQPYHGPSQPDDRRNYDSAGVIGMLAGILQNGFNLIAKFTKSIRVGSGTGLDSMVTPNDGVVAAAGPQASFIWGDRAAPNSGGYGTVFLNNGLHTVYDTTNGNWLTYTRSTATAAIMGRTILGSAGRGVRVGSGTGLDANMGTDGTLILQTLQFLDAVTPTSNALVQMQMQGTTWNMISSTGINPMTIALSTGAIYHPRSIRAGTYSGIGSSVDGQDGIIAGGGASAAIGASARDNGGFLFLWYWTGSLIRLYNNQTGDMWQIVYNTGIINQDALTALSPNANVSIVSGWNPCGSRTQKPDGAIYVWAAFAAAAALPAGYKMGGVAAAHAPTALVTVVGRYGNGPATGYIDSTGSIYCDTAMASGAIWSFTAVYYR